MAFKLFAPRVDMPREMELLASIRALESRVADLKDQLAERQSRVEALQAELAEAWRVAAVNERVTQTVKRSLSWKLTAPLRECRRGAIRSLRMLGAIPHEPAPRPMRPSLRERLRSLERRVRRYRKSLSAPLHSSLETGSPVPIILSGREKEIHEQLVRSMTIRRAA